MDEHEDRTGSFDQPATAVTHRARSSRAPGMLAAVAVVGSLAIALAASALAGTSRARQDPLVVADASAPASASPDRPKRDRSRQLGRFGRIEITSVDGNRIGLRTEDGWTRTITVTADTTILRDGETAAVGDLQVGDPVVLRQRRNDDGTFTVTRINVPAPRVAGVVTAVDGDSVTVATRRGEPVDVTVDSSTTYLIGRDAGTRADLTVGSRVSVRGILGGAPGFRAAEIRIAPPVFEGVVSATTATTITITKRDGTAVTVHVGPATRYQVRGKARAAALADVAVGSRVVATGTLRADGSMDATMIAAGRVKTAQPDGSPGG